LLDSEDKEAYKFRGHSYFKQGDYLKAIDDFSEVISLMKKENVFIFSVSEDTDSNYPNMTGRRKDDYLLADVYDHRGKAYYLNGEKDKADSDYNESKKLSPFICGCQRAEFYRY